MAHSPKGLFTFKQRKGGETPTQAVDGFIAAVEGWAKRVLDDAAKPGKAQMAAHVRTHKPNEPMSADNVHFAILAIRAANELRAELARAAKMGDDVRLQSLRCAFQMLQFCGAAFAGKTVESESWLHAGILGAIGGQKGGVASSKVTPEHRAEIHRVKAATPRGGWMAAYRRLARRLRLSQRTVQRIASEK